MKVTQTTRRFFTLAAVITTSLFTQLSLAQSDPLYHYEQLDGTNPKNAAKSKKSDEPEPELANKKDRNNTTTTIPLDGGLSLFLVAGAGIAAKKRYDAKKQKQNSIQK